MKTPPTLSTLARVTPSSRRAFSLVELLVVISIVAVLAGLLMPVFASVRSSGDNTQCVSNLHQIGVGIGLYMNDHDSNYPGPLYYGQSPWYSTYDTTTLGYNLEPYLALKPKQPWNQRANVLVCRAYERAVTLSDAPVYVTDNIPVGTGSYEFVRPWGDPGANPPTPVMKQIQTLGLSRKNSTTGQMELVSLAKTVAIRDVDQTDYATSSSRPGWYDKIPKKPVHGDHQNTLFYDLHVGRVAPITHVPN